MKPPGHLHVVPTTPEPETARTKSRARLKATEKPPAMLACPRCTGREVIETRIGAVLKSGRVTGGTKVWLCASCHRGGERVVIA